MFGSWRGIQQRGEGGVDVNDFVQVDYFSRHKDGALHKDREMIDELPRLRPGHEVFGHHKYGVMHAEQGDGGELQGPNKGPGICKVDIQSNQKSRYRRLQCVIMRKTMKFAMT